MERIQNLSLSAFSASPFKPMRLVWDNESPKLEQADLVEKMRGLAKDGKIDAKEQKDYLIIKAKTQLGRFVNQYSDEARASRHFDAIAKLDRAVESKLDALKNQKKADIQKLFSQLHDAVQGVAYSDAKSIDAALGNVEKVGAAAEKPVEVKPVEVKKEEPQAEAKPKSTQVAVANVGAATAPATEAAAKPAEQVPDVGSWNNAVNITSKNGQITAVIKELGSGEDKATHETLIKALTAMQEAAKNPSDKAAINASVLAVQREIGEYEGASNVSKDGSLDARFGTRTMTALNDIAGIEEVKPVPKKVPAVEKKAEAASSPVAQALNYETDFQREAGKATTYKINSSSASISKKSPKDKVTEETDAWRKDAETLKGKLAQFEKDAIGKRSAILDKIALFQKNQNTAVLSAQDYAKVNTHIQKLQSENRNIDDLLRFIAAKKGEAGKIGSTLDNTITAYVQGIDDPNIIFTKGRRTTAEKARQDIVKLEEEVSKRLKPEILTVAQEVIDKKLV